MYKSSYHRGFIRSVQLFMLVVGLVAFPIGDLYGGINHNDSCTPSCNINSKLSSDNGKFYSYISLLFNGNIHFINIIEHNRISADRLKDDRFPIDEFEKFLKIQASPSVKKLGSNLLNCFLHPEKCTSVKLHLLENALQKRGIVLHFSKYKDEGRVKLALDFCVFGELTPMKIHHPLFKNYGVISNIRPSIYYDEWYTSNSTFYSSMIYIDDQEVINDTGIIRDVLSGKKIRRRFYNGSQIDDNIRYCIKKSFAGIDANSSLIKDNVWRMIVVHELTHKILYNRYNFFDQVEGEELSLSSTIYDNPYLGLSVLFCYLNYNSVTPHRIAAENFVKFVAKSLGREDLVKNPSNLKELSAITLQAMAKRHFNSHVEKLVVKDRKKD